MSKIELKTLDYAPERDRLYRMKEVAPKMYAVIHILLTCIELSDINTNAVVPAYELLAYIDGEDNIEKRTSKLSTCNRNGEYV